MLRLYSILFDNNTLVKNNAFFNTLFNHNNNRNFNNKKCCHNAKMDACFQEHIDRITKRTFQNIRREAQIK